MHFWAPVKCQTESEQWSLHPWERHSLGGQRETGGQSHRTHQMLWCRWAFQCQGETDRVLGPAGEQTRVHCSDDEKDSPECACGGHPGERRGGGDPAHWGRMKTSSLSLKYTRTTRKGQRKCWKDGWKVGLLRLLPLGQVGIIAGGTEYWEKK